jgi:hypothetical protein
MRAAGGLCALTIAAHPSPADPDACSVLPPDWHSWKLPFAVTGVLFVTLLNLRGVKESVILLWVPIFCVFISRAWNRDSVCGGYFLFKSPSSQPQPERF